MNYLEISMPSNTFAVGTYRRPVSYLRRHDDAALRTEVNAELWLQGSVAYILNSPTLGLLVVATTAGTATLWARLQVDGEFVYGSVEITVDALYNWGLERSGDTEPTVAERKVAPFAHYSGYNRGVKMPFDSGEQTRSSDVVSVVPVATPSLIEIVTERPVGSQTFSIQEFVNVSKTGYGYSYGYNFGQVGEITDATN